MARASQPLTIAEEAIFAYFLLSYNGMGVGEAIRLTKAHLSDRGIVSPSSARTFQRVARRELKTWVNSKEFV